MGKVILDHTALAKEHFGLAYPQWHAGLEAMHAFAIASGCPLGNDVFAWFINQTEEYSAIVKAFAQQLKVTL